MALQKQSLPINFSQGLDQKDDPNQIAPGNFLALDNIVQTKQGLLQKRPGNKLLASLPNSSYSYLTTFNGNLTAISSDLQAYISGQQAWITKGSIQPCEVQTLPLIRNSNNQSQVDAAICESENLVCTTYREGSAYYVAIADTLTGQNVLYPTALYVNGDPTAIPTEAPKAYFFSNNFVLVFPVSTGGGTHGLYAYKIPISNLNTSSFQAISFTYETHTTGAFDAFIASNKLWVAWNAGSNNLKFCSIDSTFTQTNAASPFAAAHPAVNVSLTADITGVNPVFYATWITTVGGSPNVGYVGSFNSSLVITFGPTAITLSRNAVNVTAAAQNGAALLIFEFSNTVGGFPDNFLVQYNCTSSGTVSPTGITIVLLNRQVGLASRAVIINSTIYLLATVQSPYQSTYFLCSVTVNPNIFAPFAPQYQLNPIAKIAYGNGGGYVTTGLSNISVTSSSAIYVPYLFKDLITSVNKNTNTPTGTQVSGIYSQTGVNLATFTISTNQITATEIGSNLNINGGFLWGYDGFAATEQNFFFWPENVFYGTSTGTTGPAANTYYYVAIFSWTDAQGNTFRSAPSIPLKVDQTVSGNTITIGVQTLSLTYKTLSPVKIEIYRWSNTQQVYYQITSVSSPLLNDPTSDSVGFVDLNVTDLSILGNSILYTTGGVVEDVNGPAATAMTLFDTRLWLIDSEDQNLLWFSKQIIESTPVEMSDLFTIYIPPSTGTQGSTGVMRALFPLDERLIIFKDNAIYYISGSGPDNAGSNNNYSQPIFITSTVGCSNPRSIVLTPGGIMFQSNTGIWLLGRDLQTSYVGKQVQNYNSYSVLSALNVPNSNLVKFNLSNGVTLTYNYFFNQWGTQSGVSPISSVVYQGLTTFIDNTGATYQETPNIYLDGTSPVTMSLTTGWFNMAGLQGYERIYYFYLLGTYYSPHKLTLGIAYEYDSTVTQTSVISPDNYTVALTPSLEQWRIFMQQQRCQAFQITMTESYDSSFGVAAGQGVTLSGFNFVIGEKKTYKPIAAKNTVG